VYEDYKLQLTIGASHCYRALEYATGKLSDVMSASPRGDNQLYTNMFQSIQATTPSSDHILALDTDCTSNTSVVVSVYNSLAWDRSEFVFLATNCSNIASVTVGGKVTRLQYELHPASVYIKSTTELCVAFLR
jgi:hypothetical protein